MAKKLVKQPTLSEFRSQFPDEHACREYLCARRWPGGITCPRCQNDKVYALPSKAHHWQCHQCAPKGYRFSVLVGTIFENTNIPLTMWFEVIYRMMTSKKGVSALEIHRTMGTGSYRTAWSMCHRIRAGMADESFRQLTGFVEMDEAYIGGKDKNKHWPRRNGGSRGGKGKIAVIGAVKRGRNVIARAVDSCNSYTLAEFIKETISHEVSLLSTDASRLYPRIPNIKRGVVIHSRHQYVVGASHTNTIEGFWSQFKRGIVGSFHKVTKKYLPLYVAEFEFRYNSRTDPDIFGAAGATA